MFTRVNVAALQAGLYNVVVECLILDPAACQNLGSGVLQFAHSDLERFTVLQTSNDFGSHPMLNYKHMCYGWFFIQVKNYNLIQLNDLAHRWAVIAV